MRYRLPFEDVVANVRALWESARKLDPHTRIYQLPFLTPDGTSGGVYQIAPDATKRVWKALAATVPHPYVLEFCYTNRAQVQFLAVNSAVTAHILAAWTREPGLALWLSEIQVIPYDPASSLTNLYTRTFTTDLSQSCSNLPLPQRQLLTRCEPMKSVITGCDQTRAAWNTSCIPLSPPLVVSGEVVHGFNRGSKDIGCATANIGGPNGTPPQISLDSILLPGTYAGHAKLRNNSYPAVVSIGFNPYYENSQITVEAHLFEEFSEDFYGAWVELELSSFNRAESNFADFSELVMAIQLDCERVLCGSACSTSVVQSSATEKGQ